MPSIVEASLVMTILNEGSSISRFLDSVHEQTACPREIVIVDGGSTDDTVAVINRWDPPTGCSVRVVIKEGAGISLGRNLAFDAASSERILVTDAGTFMDPRWVERMHAAFDSDESPSVVSGWFFPEGAQGLERTIAYIITPRLDEIRPESFLPSSRSLGVTRAAWRSVGGYPEWLDYCEDLVFDLALKAAGYQFVFVPSARVSWSGRASWKAFAKQYYRYARGDGKAGLWAKRHAVRYVAYLVGVAGVVVSVSQPWVLVPLAIGGAVYMRKFVSRVVRRRSEYGHGWVRAAALAPAVVVVGDVAKMIGYPIGLMWKRRNPRPSAVSLTILPEGEVTT